MDTHVLEDMARGGFEMVIAVHDRRSRLRAFLALHDTSPGLALGGLRRWSYRSEDEALRDCLRLAEGMTYKCALAGLPAGGAKLVLLDAPELDLERAYEHVGELVQSLGGRFCTGPDVGTGERELAWVARRTGFVTRPGVEGPGDLADATAEGVFAGIGAALRHLDGEAELAGRRIVVQGVGSVGRRLAARLCAAGAEVLCSDIDLERGWDAARELGVELVDPSRELEVPCDVFAPCALGGIVHDLSIERLRCRIVAGAANNVLARELHADRLHARGILYAPDFAISSGALLRGGIFQLEGRRASLEEIGRRIEQTLASIFERAREEELPPARVALVEARQRMELARRSRERSPRRAIETS